MAHAEKCPVCDGERILRYIDETRVTGIHLGGETEKQCHGCNGKGWVEVKDNEASPPSDAVFVTNPEPEAPKNRTG